MSGRQWTPFQVHIVLHHHASFAKFERWTAPIYESTVAELVTIGVLQAFDKPRHENDESMIGTTDLGNALVEMWLQTPLPRSVMIDPRDGKHVMVEYPVTRSVAGARPEAWPPDKWEGGEAIKEAWTRSGDILKATPDRSPEPTHVEPEPTHTVTSPQHSGPFIAWPRGYE